MAITKKQSNAIAAFKKAIKPASSLITKAPVKQTTSSSTQSKIAAVKQSLQPASSLMTKSPLMTQAPLVLSALNKSSKSSSNKSSSNNSQPTIQAPTMDASKLATYAGNVPKVPAVVSPFTEGVTTSGMAGLTTQQTTPETKPKEQTGSAQELFNQYLTASKENQMPNLADEYAKAERDAEIQQKQQAVNDYSAQLNTIVAKQQSDLLNLRGVGATEGVTEAVYGGQAATINREAAIAALPVQAQLAAAQGNLEMAQERLDILFKLKTEDARNQYEFNNKIIDRYYQFASEEQQRALDEKKEERQRAYDVEDRNISIAQSWAKEAASNGDFNTAAAIGRLDSNSATFEQDLAGLTSRMSTARTSEAPKVVSVNGVDSIWDGTKFVPAQSAGGSVNTIANMRDEDKIQNLSNMINDSYLNSAVGANRLARLSPTSLVTAGKSNFVADVEQLVKSLSLDALLEAKANGATFGALDKSEWDILGASATKIQNWREESLFGDKIEGYKTTPKEMQAELDKINRFASMDYILKGGTPEDIGLIRTPDGNMWYKNADESLTQLIR